MTGNKFNRDLSTVILLVSLVVMIRLVVTANQEENWRGLFYSGLHVLIVATCSFFALRKKSDEK